MFKPGFSSLTSLTFVCGMAISQVSLALCPSTGATAECLENDLRVQEELMTKRYDTLYQASGKEEQESLTSTQTLWKQYRDSACQTEASSSKEKSVVERAKLELLCLVRMTKQRAKELGVINETNDVEEQVKPEEVVSIIEEGENLATLEDFMSEVEVVMTLGNDQADRQRAMIKSLVEWVGSVVEDINTKHGKVLFDMPELNLDVMALENNKRCKVLKNSICVGADKEIKLKKMEDAIVFFGPKSFVDEASNSIIIAQEKVKVVRAKDTIIIAKKHITLSNSQKSLVLTPGTTTAMAVQNSVVYAENGVLPDMRSAIHCLNSEKDINAKGHCYDVTIKKFDL